ncbi:hypothetical protein FOCC_FOCC014084 [Frankliniella occidentalis]|uniref:Uncharacterized protein LOC113213678 n=1 Tax=Frankliniella occidentalis TaxID=133901 RepID=A0A6J1TCN4_FRAOC|nr:uncharacterized protein LOC113213678 [Frankliniella occidentalis]KAE8740405.1 hypothetical protein FOCC_FOCC014084 [Frankliniella occidentalis]
MEHQTGVQVPVAAAVDYFDTEALDGDMLDAFLAQIQEQQLARAHMDVNELSGAPQNESPKTRKPVRRARSAASAASKTGKSVKPRKAPRSVSTVRGSSTASQPLPPRPRRPSSLAVQKTYCPHIERLCHILRMVACHSCAPTPCCR